MAKKIATLIFQLLIICVLTMTFEEIYVRLFQKVDDIAPKLLKEKFLKYEPTVFALHVCLQKEQNITQRGWLVNGQPRKHYINISNSPKK